VSALRVADSVLAKLVWLAAAFTVVVLLAGPSLIGAKKHGAAAAPAYGAPAASTAADGKAVFAKSGCGGCHTLAAAGASGTTGPNLDQAKPDKAAVTAIVNSGAGIMPSFKGKLSDAEIAAVADYVSSAAGSK
jgi:mono/diheme cytochrome c family protein